MTKYIKADSFFYPYEVKGSGFLEITDGCFGQWQSEVPQEADIIDCTGYSVAPGLVDTHIHGYAGADTMDNSGASLEKMSQALLAAGVTSFLPTALTASFEKLKAICQTAAEFAGQETGAKIQGLYFEGPYFTETYKGAQNTAYMRNPSCQELDAWLTASQGLLRKIAIAPEREGSEEFIPYAREKGVTVALGHSNATYQQAVEAVEAGANVWVHAYNGMRGLSHCEPGMLGAVYSLPNTYAELICDGHHVTPVACDILMKQKGHHQVALITDCMSAGGLADGDYMLGEFPVIVANGTARLKEGGNLAGSVLELKDAVKNVADWGIASKAEAVRMASLIPAKSVGIDDRCGQIKKGHPADFIVLDHDLNLMATYLGGEIAWKKA